ncbi:hypothetical protein ACOYA6_07735 [Leclercia barmai]|uniref:Cleavage/polyadenylation specificity factor A subunit N-terminal domain-containing protein n=2 Tax=Enterobacteriaceae TaxID=543 RepID=A0ABS7RZN3_9ENTR|nr:hypothetical protein [Leclercia sp. EMC7]MBZ0059732.1 hypothetical protein [Leclercia sp. EMC7]MCM5699527.1 hypothetical protein [Leclercia sp. LTM14]
MSLQATWHEQPAPGDETEGVSIIDVNPFGPNGEKDRRLLISNDGEPLLILQLYIRADEDGWLISSAFSGFLLNESHVAIICGDHFHVFEMATHTFRSYPLGDYVGHLYSVPDIHSDRLQDRVLVATYCHVFLMDIAAGILWKSGQCAIDGVIVTSIENDTVLGEGEWDPPGGWESFKLDLKTGILI